MSVPVVIGRLNLSKSVNNIITSIKLNDGLLCDFSKIVVYVMSEVEKLVGVSGEEKKELVLYITNEVKVFIKSDKSVSNDWKYIIDVLLDPSSVSVLIETIMDIAKGRFKINEKQVSCVGGVLAKLLCKDKKN